MWLMVREKQSTVSRTSSNEVTPLSELESELAPESMMTDAYQFRRAYQVFTEHTKAGTLPFSRGLLGDDDGGDRGGSSDLMTKTHGGLRWGDGVQCRRFGSRIRRGTCWRSPAWTVVSR